MPKANNLHDLISKSSSTRSFFLSLPVATQLTLHKYNDNICTAEQLHQYADHITNAKFPNLN